MDETNNTGLGIEMQSNNTVWNKFCEEAAAHMCGVLENRVTLESAAAFFENDRTISDPDLREYIDYSIWEIGGAPNYWQELLELFEAKASQDTLIKRLRSK